MRKLTQTIANIVILYLTYLAIVQNTIWAGRVITFIVVISAIIYTLLFLSKEGRVKSREIGASLPKPINIGMDLILLFGFVAAGWWGLVVIHLWQILFFYNLFYGKDPVTDEDIKEALDNDPDSYRSVYTVDDEGTADKGTRLNWKGRLPRY